MEKRSPVLGYNHNFKHRGLIFHVQTEDSGVGNPHLFTHLFHGGVIISSRRVDYDADSEVETVKSLMQSQHKAVLKDLKSGTFDDKIDLYLGNKPNLLPRKTPVPSSSIDTPVPMPDIEPPAAHSGAISLDSVPVPVEDDGGTIPIDLPPVYETLPPRISKIPPIPDRRERLPTPIAVPIMRDGEEQLGDPTVTFKQAGAPDVPIQGERSGTYSLRRPRSGTGEFVSGRGRRVSGHPGSPRAGHAVAAGKAANPEPGKPRSSVVVSRPAVIIGAPPQMAGKDRKPKRTPQPRKARSDNLFGQDMISEKSLDEVIMAYLSEDSSEE